MSGSPLASSMPAPPAVDGLTWDPTAAPRREVSSLFVDVVGSMSISSWVSAEAWWEIVEGLLTLLADGVRRHGGQVESFTGDGIAAVFGHDGGRSEHAAAACTAALWLRDASLRYARSLARSRGVALAVRIGVNSGEVIVGQVGCPGDQRTVCIGHAVGVAKRIESVAAPGTVYISQATAALVRGRFELSEIGPRELRGCPRRLVLFELIGAYGAARTMATAARPRLAMAA